MKKIQPQEAAKLTEPHLEDGTYNPYTETNQGYIVEPSEQASVKQSDNQDEVPFFVVFIAVVLIYCSTIGLRSLFEALVPKIGNRSKKSTRQRSADK